MSLLVTGSIGIDSIQTPTGHADEVLGGSAIYFAAAASFSGPVRLVAAVGEDFPDPMQETFSRFDIDLRGLEVRAGAKTFRWTGRYLENMNDRETLSVELNVLAGDLPPVPVGYTDSRFVFLANTHPGGQLALRKQFEQAELVVADTMDLWIDNERDLLTQLLQQIDGLVLNDSEAHLLTGERNPVTAGQKILGLGPKFVIIKKGEHGALLIHGDGLCNLPAFPTADVVDPTGAGDTFGGGFMGHIAATGDTSFANLKHAMAVGTVIASFTLETFSLERLLTLTEHDIQHRLNRYTEMLSIG